MVLNMAMKNDNVITSLYMLVLYFCLFLCYSDLHKQYSVKNICMHAPFLCPQRHLRVSLMDRGVL